MIRTTPFYTRLAHVLISIICLFYLAIIGETLLAPLIFAFLFSLLLLPFANFLERKWKFPRSLSSAVVLLTLIVAISAILYLLLNQLSDLTSDLPAFKAQLLATSTDLQNWISDTFHIDNHEQISYINSATSEALSKGTSLLGQTLLSVSSLMLFLVFIFLYTFFILLHRRLLLNFLVSLFKEEHSVIVYDVVSNIQYIVKKYIVGLFIQMLIVTVLACTAFEIIGIKYALLLGLITGIFNIIPYIGILTALLMTVLLTFSTMGSTAVLLVVVTVFVIHLIDSNYVMPKIVGSKVKINTLTALIGLVLGELIWGVKGMFLSIPIIAIFKVVFDRVDGLKPWGYVLGEEENVAEPEIVKVDDDIDKNL
ncbi:AI-2E family transporter [uncultured Flavobacterium sp.]|uniref:AI-2E family transporter n=1 Tax=uncultured Flavobacterium sp. TaxID=165435 RepID=UPI0025CFB5F3|nr:AI-2E family transporter [uncultured Flavobacterium sp.]